MKPEIGNWLVDIGGMRAVDQIYSNKQSVKDELERYNHVAKTFEEFKHALRRHEEATRTKFILYKGPAKFRNSEAKPTPQMRLHWSRGIPYFHFGVRNYLCHKGKDINRSRKEKYAKERDEKALVENVLVKRYQKRKMSKKVDCPAEVNVLHILRLPNYQIPMISKYCKEKQSHLIKEKIKSNEPLYGDDIYIYNLPSKEEHGNHEFDDEPATKKSRYGTSHNSEFEHKLSLGKAICKEMHIANNVTIESSNEQESYLVEEHVVEYDMPALEQDANSEANETFCSQENQKEKIIVDCHATIYEIENKLGLLDVPALNDAQNKLKELSDYLSHFTTSSACKQIPVEPTTNLTRTPDSNSRELKSHSTKRISTECSKPTFIVVSGSSPGEDLIVTNIDTSNLSVVTLKASLGFI